MNRRNFLQAILATGVAPFVVTTAGVLMPVKKVIAPDYVLTPPLVAFQDGMWIFGTDENGLQVTGRINLATGAEIYQRKFKTINRIMVSHSKPNVEHVALSEYIAHRFNPMDWKS